MAPRCTPPSPPVANTRMPASAARCAVAATVVAPRAPARGEDRQVAHARLGEVVVGDAAHALGVQSDLRHAVEHGDRGRGDARVAQDRLELERRLVVARPRQAVAR